MEHQTGIYNNYDTFSQSLGSEKSEKNKKKETVDRTRFQLAAQVESES